MSLLKRSYRLPSTYSTTGALVPTSRPVKKPKTMWGIGPMIRSGSMVTKYVPKLLEKAETSEQIGRASCRERVKDSDVEDYLRKCKLEDQGQAMRNATTR